MSASLPAAADEPPRIPRAAFISAIAALAFTTGLTVAVVPALRRRHHRPKETFQFLSNASLVRGASAPRRVTRPGRVDAAVPTTIPPSPASATKGNPSRTILDDPSPGLHPLHPPEPDAGPGEGTISPLFALGAFGIATGLVCLGAGVTTVAIAKILDVRDMDEFTAKMRTHTARLLPTKNLYRPPPTDVPIDHEPPVDEEDTVVRRWVEEVVQELEGDRRRLVEERRLG